MFYLKKLTKNKSNLFSKIFNPAFSLSTATKTLTLDLFNLFLVILGIVLLISLWTFEISDPNWKEISSSETNLTNSIGIVGAWLSSFLYESLGITAWAMIILFFYPAFMSYLKNTEEKPAQKNYFFGISGFFIFCSSLCLSLIHI